MSIIYNKYTPFAKLFFLEWGIFFAKNFVYKYNWVVDFGK